jgi:hypothetical protein
VVLEAPSASRERYADRHSRHADRHSRHADRHSRHADRHSRRADRDARRPTPVRQSRQRAGSDAPPKIMP